MLKKFLILTMFLSCLACSVTANAQSLYSGNVSNVIKAFKMVGNEIGFSVWGTEYYTYKGIKRCELHFGNTENNLIRFRLNNDNSVARMLITIRNSYNDSDLDNALQAGILGGTACIIFGVSENEYKQMWKTFTLDAFDNLFDSYFHKNYSVWASGTQQYIVMDVEMDTSKCDLYFYVD